MSNFRRQWNKIYDFSEDKTVLTLCQAALALSMKIMSGPAGRCEPASFMKLHEITGEWPMRPWRNPTSWSAAATTVSRSHLDFRCTLLLLSLTLCKIEELGFQVLLWAPSWLRSQNTPTSSPASAQWNKNLPEDTPPSVHWLFGVQTSASFLLSFNQHLASWHSVQHHNGFSNGQTSPLFSKGNLAILCFTNSAPCSVPKASYGEMFTQHPCQ